MNDGEDDNNNGSDDGHWNNHNHDHDFNNCDYNKGGPSARYVIFLEVGSIYYIILNPSELF